MIKSKSSKKEKKGALKRSQPAGVAEKDAWDPMKKKGEISYLSFITKLVVHDWGKYFSNKESGRHVHQRQFNEHAGL